MQTIGWPARGARLREAGFGIGWGLASQVGIVRIVAFLVAVGLVVDLGPSTSRCPPQVRHRPHGVGGSCALVVYAVIVAPVLEEFVFRGLLFHSIADRRGFWAGAIASAIPFGRFIHVIPGPALDVSVLVSAMMVTGVLWAWIHWRHRNLLVNIAGPCRVQRSSASSSSSPGWRCQDMPEFPTEEWFQAFIEAINASEEYAEYAATWEGDAIIQVEAEPDKGIAADVHGLLDLWHGGMPRRRHRRSRRGRRPRSSWSARRTRDGRT